MNLYIYLKDFLMIHPIWFQNEKKKEIVCNWEFLNEWYEK